MCFGNNREKKHRTLVHNTRLSTVSFIQLREKGTFAGLANCCKPETMELRPKCVLCALCEWETSNEQTCAI